MRLEDLPKSYEPKEHEEEIYRIWEASGFFNPDALPDAAKRKPFTIMMAPPNVTGHIHAGHALENIISDIIIRRKRMEGYKTLFLPGKDHAGIAGQYVVEKDLKKEGKTRQSLGREKFIERVWEWMREYGSAIDQELKLLGISTDWSRSRFTMDPGYQQAVEKVFIHYHKEGYIYRGKRVVNWCPRCQTTLSDLEVEYEEEKGKLYFIKYGPVTVATARPETKLGDTALAANPKDARYGAYLNQRITFNSPDPDILRHKKPKLKEFAIKVVEDVAADPDFGTGIIKVTPAHDIQDYEIYERHPEIGIHEVIGEDGKMRRDAGRRYQGLSVAEAREQIVKDLEALDLLEKTEEYTHSVARCARCENVVEPLLSRQWYLSMKKLAGLAKNAIEKNRVNFIPASRRTIMLAWIENIKDWNISRQLWWGHRIPAWHCGCPTDTEVWHVGTSAPKELCRKCRKEWQQSSDVLDTWFSSALWPFVTLGWPDETDDLKTFYPTDIISSAREIFFLWITRMLFSGIEFLKKPPFKTIYTHPTILDKYGRKMSKSKGNVVDPVRIIREYGIDAARFGLIWQAMGTQDIHWSEDGFRAGKKFLNKIWNSGRFVLAKIGDGRRPLRRPRPRKPENKKILEKFDEVKAQLEKMYPALEVGPALHLLYDFYWHSFCDIFLEEAKKDNSDETQNTLLFVLASSLKLLHPFIPFITEYLWGMLPSENKKLLIVESI